MSATPPSARPSNWQARAFNQVPESDNRIHSDELAKAYGFTGALVPGVTVSCYLTHPAVECWGLDWLERGAAHVTVKSPLYDNNAFEVAVIPDKKSYQAELSSAGRLCAVAKVSLPARAPVPPDYRADISLRADYVAPAVSRAVMEAFKAYGCPAQTFLWSADHEMASYLRDPLHMAKLHWPDAASGQAGYANMSFLLGCANRHFAAIARMSPWIHLETWSQNFQAVPSGTVLISEMRISNLFEKKGHEFADCEFNLFRADTGACVCSISQRAIYKMREPEQVR